MSGSVELANYLMLAVVVIGWAALGVAFLRRPRSPRVRNSVRPDLVSRFGIVLGVVGFALVWGLRRSPTQTSLGLPVPLHWVVVLLTAGLVVIAAWLLWGAFRALGRQWSAEARVLTGHELVTTGPYAHVRHPIYVGLGAMLLATGFALSRPMALLGGGLLYGIGTALRIHREEALLREMFGERYRAYAERVAAVVPRL